MSDKISLLLPTRKRPEKFKRAVESFIKNANSYGSYELVVGIEIDDIETIQAYNDIKLIYREADWSLVLFEDKNISLNQKYNLLKNEAIHDIMFGIADDNIMLTPQWDDMIIEEFTFYPDKIVCVAINDGRGSGELYRHFAIHRKWIDTVGYYYNENFKHFYIDNLVTATSKALGRDRYLPDLVMDHKHFVFGTAEVDENNRIAYGQEFKIDEEAFKKYANMIVNYEVNVLKDKLDETPAMVTNYI